MHPHVAQPAMPAVVLLFPSEEERVRRARVRAQMEYDRALRGGHRSASAARRALRMADACTLDTPEPPFAA